MQRYPMQRRSPPRQRVVYVKPRRHRRPKRPFRWYVVLIPLLILFVMWLAEGLRPALSWNDFMDVLGIRQRERWSQLAALGVIICATLAILRVLRGKRRNEDV